MRLVINLLLLGIVAALAYMLYFGIKEPIKFDTEKTARLDAVTTKLKDIRTAQECYRGITGKFASSFDSLTYVLKNDSFLIVKIIGDPDDPTGGNFVRTESYRHAADSLQTLGLLDKLDDFASVPFSNGELFELQADTLTYQKALVNVVECRTRYKSFMGDYADPKYAKYDNTYDPSNYVKFGDMSAPNLNGNWE